MRTSQIESEFCERYNRAINALRQNNEVRENLLQKFPEMKLNDIMSPSKLCNQAIQKNLIPNVVAVNKRELIDFNRKAEKEEKAKKERPLTRKIKDKLMANIYLNKPVSERSKSRKKSRAESLQS